MKKGKWVWIILVICFIAYCGKDSDETKMSDEGEISHTVTSNPNYEKKTESKFSDKEVNQVVTAVPKVNTNLISLDSFSETEIEEFHAFATEQSAKLSGKGYKIEDFPYGKETSFELIQHYLNIINGDITVTKAYVKEDKNGVHKITIEEEEYIYYGELKDNKPEGLGVVLKCTSYGMYCLEKVGYFKNGCLDGNALVFDISYADYGIIAFAKDYEGDYSMGQQTGEGIEYSYLEYYDLLYYREYNENSKVIYWDGVEILTDLILRTEDISYIGDFKNGERHGKGVIIVGGELYFAGSFEDGEYIKGKLYDDGNLLYDGEFKREQYHGKGILYNEDGSVRYKGEFKNGDIK